jgi:GNAT superfamily N-acetyltransferase
MTTVNEADLTIGLAGEVEAAGASLVIALTSEICDRTDTERFPIDLPGTTTLCRRLLEMGHYTVLLGRLRGKPVAVATIAESHAWYAGGKIGIIQEFYVMPAVRSHGIGAKMIDAVRDLGAHREWACIERCTPPLPVFEGALQFYERHAFKPVGGRKMRWRVGG